MRVHAVCTRRPHFGDHSGITQFLKHIDPGLCRIELYTASDSDADFPISAPWARRILRYAVQSRGMEYYKLSDLVAEVIAWRKCRNRGADILHYIDGEHSAQYLPSLWSKKARSGTKVVATFHQPPARLPKLTSPKAIRGLDHVTVVSPEQLPFFQELLGPDRVSLIPHGIDVEHFRPGTLPEDKSTFRCLTVGHWLRDFAALRQVAMRLKSRQDVEFHVVASSRIISRIPEIEGLDNVKLHSNHLGDAALLELYQRSQILFLPLLDATANNALLEGIACGLPVLSTDLPSVKAYLDCGSAILVRGNAPEAFAEAILRLRNEVSLRKEMARRARVCAEKLDWRRIATQYESLYARIVDRPGRMAEEKETSGRGFES
ncbi:MAG TPA: glycosyltransferase family 4 protein [Candidatus Eisenbacteria bacterium]|nr:glycosyltransferase family 4 protein [Candidatus Eisenbacteria bacterium]